SGWSGLTRRRRWRNRILETWPRREPLIVGGKRLFRRDRRGTFRKFLHVEQDRHHIEIGKGEAIAGKITAFGNAASEKPDFFLQLGRDSIDRLAIGLPVRRLGKNIREQVIADQGRVYPGIDERHPLLRERGFAWISWNELRPAEYKVQIGGDRLG